MPTCLFALGSNGTGQLGIGNQDDASIPQQCIFDSPATLPDDEQITDIRAGGNHTLLLTANGCVCGSGSHGALPAITRDLSTFHQLDVARLCNISSRSKVTHIAACWEASYFVVDQQVVYACGIGTKGELGLGEEVSHCSTPASAFDLRRNGNADAGPAIISISGGMSHVVLVTDNGEVYGWGTSRKGELGHELVNEKVIWKPRRLAIGFPALGVVAGRTFTFFWGGKGKQALLGNAKIIPGGEPLKLFTQSQVFAGWSSLYVLDSGELDAVGGGSRGQVPTTKLPTLAHFAAGSEHAVGVTADSKIIAFGWGEHGNCGEPIDSRGNVAGRYNSISIALGPQEVISVVGAGCATTFVAVSSPNNSS
ncbi:hypothetical protein DV736_g5230, partial [Chaetothyriales sp. CBS 134916]